VRYACIFSLVLSGLVGLTAMREVVDLTHLEELRDAPALAMWPDNELNERFKATLLSALEQMRTIRALTVGALAVLCGLCLTSAMKLLRPGELPREGVRRLLSTSLLWAGVLRTVDGAGAAVISRKVLLATSDGLASQMGLSPAQAEGARQVLSVAGPLGSAAFTAVVAGSFILLAQFFRSARVRQLLGDA
jgi:hypothetical protein